MKTKIGRKYITISPVPKYDVPNGIHITVKDTFNASITIPMVTDIFKGQSRYSIEELKKYEIVKVSITKLSDYNKNG